MRAVLAFSVRQGWPTFPWDPRGGAYATG